LLSERIGKLEARLKSVTQSLKNKQDVMATIRRDQQLPLSDYSTT
jgi:hypothetical protein